MSRIQAQHSVTFIVCHSVRFPGLNIEFAQLIVYQFEHTTVLYLKIIPNMLKIVCQSNTVYFVKGPPIIYFIRNGSGSETGPKTI